MSAASRAQLRPLCQARDSGHGALSLGWHSPVPCPGTAEDPQAPCKSWWQAEESPKEPALTKRMGDMEWTDPSLLWSLGAWKWGVSFNALQSLFPPPSNLPLPLVPSAGSIALECTGSTSSLLLTSHSPSLDPFIPARNKSTSQLWMSPRCQTSQAIGVFSPRRGVGLEATLRGWRKWAFPSPPFPWKIPQSLRMHAALGPSTCQDPF